jgi:predicted AlkP superfamily pyrophosphatase or phosphodiesterase
MNAESGADMKVTSCGMILAMFLLPLPAAAKQPQVHDDASLRVSRVLLISIDGLHAVNVANYIQSNPDSTLAQLNAIGVTYTNASTSRPSDSIPGFLAQITGGNPRTTGVWYEVSYRRDLSPPHSDCKTVGTVVYVDDEIDTDPSKLDGGGISVNSLPRDPEHGCKPVYPHELLRVNTIFEVAHDHGLRTAWADKHLAYEFANGPSGRGVDDLYTPEIAAINPHDGNDWAATLKDVETYDDFKVQALIHEVDGLDHTGNKEAGVPAIFGMNFQSIHIGQKHAVDPASGKGGYIDANGTPGPFLSEALNFVDAELGKLISELKQKRLLDSTVIIVSAKHGDSPMDVTKRRIIDMTLPAQIIGDSLAYDQSDDGSVIWLKDPGQTASVLALLNSPENQQRLGVQEIFAGNLLKQTFGDPATDPRVPDIILKTETGVMFHKVTNTKLSENGGINEDDLHVALLVANPKLARREFHGPVQTTQIAPTILEFLGLRPSELRAVQIEETPTLPGLHLRAK